MVQLNMLFFQVVFAALVELQVAVTTVPLVLLL